MEKNNSLDRWHNLIVYLFFAILVWVVWFFKFSRFGYYEDDYWYAVMPSNLNFRELLADLWEKLINFKGNQGRFVGYTVPFFLTHVLYHIAGLPMLYIFGVFLVAFNAYLIYRLISRLNEWWFGFFAGLIFIVFPADSSKILIVHIYQLQLSLMFTLLAFNLFDSRKVLSYLLALASLLTYENAFLAYIFVPFLRMNLFNYGTLKKWIRHAAIFFLFVLVIFIIRKLTGEARVSEMGSDTARKLILSLIAGPLISLYSYFSIPMESLQQFRTTWPMFAGILVILVLVFLYVKNRITLKESTFNRKGFIEEWNHFPRSYLYLCILGLLMLSAGYLFAFTHFPPLELAGRRTSVHLGGTIGSVLFFVSAWLYLLSVIRSKRLKSVLVFVLIGWISLLGSRALLVQNDFVESWNFQKKLYDQIFTQAPDMDEGDIILLENQNLVRTKYIESYGWPLPGIPELLIDFPQEYKAPPRIVLAETDPESFFSVQDSNVYFVPMYPFLYGDLDTVYIASGDLIYLQMIDQKVVRIEEDPFFEEYGIQVKKAPDPDKIIDFDKKLTYRDFILEER